MRRPYECVRRAWHSDTHQPIRGSLIQEIFRIVGEIHTPGTKSNKEWQEKLPIVVLKAEEIIYSKANSQAEYMDVVTLRERVNDAINTIIRRDESSEEAGEFLQPCIEAALHLGCIPRRAPRSQRNYHPRCYLSGNLDLGNNAMEVNPGQNISPLVAPYVNMLNKESSKFVVPINSCVSNEMPFLVAQKCSPLDPPHSSCFPLNPFPLYPLYYDVSPHEMIRREPPENPPEIVECDLSLRLGLGSVQQKGENASLQQQHQTSRKNTFERSLGDPDIGSVGFSLFGNSLRSKCEEGLDVVEMGRKRKAFDPINDLHCSSSSWQANAGFEQRSNDGSKHPWQPNLLPAYPNQRTRTAGS